MVNWAVPEYSRGQVNRAGFAYIDSLTSPEEKEFALATINNWRSSHAFPLNTLQVTLRQRARAIDPNSTVAQRIKRLPSITAKLESQRNMSLARMQDIGGCRAVMESLKEVDSLFVRYQKGNGRHSLVRADDYIRDKPKESGYRGIHLVYSYKSDEKTTYNGLRIEVQLRSRLQHAWATAVETVGTFTQQALKSSQGQADWLRFFVLMSSELALREGTRPIPGTPTSRSELRTELGAYATKLEVVSRLNAYGSTLDVMDQIRGKKERYFLLELNGSSGELTLRGYTNLTQATDAYDAIERLTGQHPELDAVLVSVESLAQLKRAYPNYFLDTEYFVETLLESL